MLQTRPKQVNFKLAFKEAINLQCLIFSGREFHVTTQL